MEHKQNLQSAQSAHHCCCDEQPAPAKDTGRKNAIPLIITLLMLVAGMLLEHLVEAAWFTTYVELAWYLAAYVLVAFPVFRNTLEALKNKSVFNEFVMIVVATIGAFVVREYPEGVAVMLFYRVGEWLQDSAVNKARRNIKALLDLRPDTATVLRNGVYCTVAPETVQVGEVIQIKAGEKAPLDGVLLSTDGSVNAAALTGESRPRTLHRDDAVLAGMLNLDRVIEVRVTHEYADSSLAKILEMVQNAASRKARTELFIRRFAQIYTPIIFALALAITVLPYFFVSPYVFADWFYRALVFLMISCPCALVISIPLGYFGGIGAASRHGILFKGANYMDLLTKVNIVVMDKTGTLTQGVFQVKQAEAARGGNAEFVTLAACLERSSNHPVAKAIVAYCPQVGDGYAVQDVQEMAGCGLSGKVNGKSVLAGSAKLMQRYNVEYDHAVDDIVETTVMVAIDNVYAGYITIADQEKDDAAATIAQLQRQGVHTVMLSGDKTSITQQVATRLRIDEFHGDLLPQDKVQHIERLKAQPHTTLAFVGDGINDAPALALSDVGIAMGGLGSDAAVSVADVIIQTDQPSKIVDAIKIARFTRRIVLQNITMALCIKLLVLAFGAAGHVTMWAAMFADVGVALAAVLNAVRILHKRFCR
ncbi:cadmium/zinc/cobalt-transporting ATPase [Bacteroidia bacterium]|nr:cadmium/zinc/cobalt-transporting ATPase [Bacteroidia bacterium]